MLPGERREHRRNARTILFRKSTWSDLRLYLGRALAGLSRLFLQPACPLVGERKVVHCLRRSGSRHPRLALCLANSGPKDSRDDPAKSKFYQNSERNNGVGDKLSNLEYYRFVGNNG